MTGHKGRFVPSPLGVVLWLLVVLATGGKEQWIGAHAQESDITILQDGQESLFPTSIEESTPAPTTATPTASPTAAPTAPTPSPSAFPTVSHQPSPAPTTTVSPSASPSISSAPSASMVPSSSPSVSPTATPSHSPTVSPSASPSISFQPSVSLLPTISPQPTVSPAPSTSPSVSPSDAPSLSPTASPAPSSSPSASPTSAPTVSAQPSSSPSLSHAPTISPAPTGTPSASPTAAPTPSPTISAYPSASPTTTPSALPTVTASHMPTITEMTIVQPSIFMLLSGIYTEINGTDQELWANITENHVLRYWRKSEHDLPTIVDITVTAVFDTVMQHQEFDVGNDEMLLVIEYSQSMTLGLYSNDLEGEELTKGVFQDPFYYDAHSYILDLIPALDLDDWIEVRAVIVGDTEAPTAAPVLAPVSSPIIPEANLSSAAVGAISASIILSAILLVAYLFWDRHRKEARFLQENREYGENMDDNDYHPAWQRNYSINMEDTGMAVTPATSMAERGGSVRGQEGSDADIPVIPSPTPYGTTVATPTRTRSNNFPPMPYASRRPGAGPPMPNSMPPNRHTSGTATEITDYTDLTASENFGDNGSEDNFGPPLLPTINDDMSGVRSPWSPLNESANDMFGGYNEDPQDDGMMGYPNSRDEDVHSMSGFQMEVQELE